VEINSIRIKLLVMSFEQIGVNVERNVTDIDRINGIEEERNA